MIGRRRLRLPYAKGARTFERHIDIDTDGAAVAAYSSLPQHIDAWFKAYEKARVYCGASGQQRKLPLARETAYLDSYIRGVYAKRDLPAGSVLTEDDVYLAIPLQKGQISCREFMRGEVMVLPCAADQPIAIDMIDSPYAENDELKAGDLRTRPGASGQPARELVVHAAEESGLAVQCRTERSHFVKSLETSAQTEHYL